MTDEEGTDGGENKKSLGAPFDHYYEVMESHDLTELEVKEGDVYIKLSRATAPVAPVFHAVHAPGTGGVPVVAPKQNSVKELHHPVTSPLGGIFYRSPSPNAPSFVKEGDKVAFGDVLCLVEAMKVMNEIRSDRPGVVHKVVAENGKPVSTGQELFLLDSPPA